ncbi:MAG: patatin-like phospholipase family protein [Planctomycetota bacterium]
MRSTIGLLLLLAACASAPKRNAIPDALSEQAQVEGIPLAREWGDAPASYWKRHVELPGEEMRADWPALVGVEHSYLALSGGGANGAFGAGLLCGWTKAGNRPEFQVVSGISAGALTAIFAFLGPEYDAVLEAAYTQTKTDDLIRQRNWLATITSDAAADVDGLRARIRELVTDAMIDAVAREYARGRLLLIGTTNLDARRPVLWNIGEIARSDRPERYDLVRDVLLASASIPGLFPPVLFDVVARGKRFDELHVDGGATAQVFLYPTAVDWTVFTRELRVKGKPRAFIVRNWKLSPMPAQVKPKFFDIAGASIQTLLRTQGEGDLHRIYNTCLRDDIEFNLIAIPDGFLVPSKEFFDPDYMKSLFAVGFALGKSGEGWMDTPPAFEVTPE